jgi:hypothetical protein
VFGVPEWQIAIWSRTRIAPADSATLAAMSRHLEGDPRVIAPVVARDARRGFLAARFRVDAETWERARRVSGEAFHRAMSTMGYDEPSSELRIIAGRVDA